MNRSAPGPVAWVQPSPWAAPRCFPPRTMLQYLTELPCNNGWCLTPQTTPLVFSWHGFRDSPFAFFAPQASLWCWPVQLVQRTHPFEASIVWALSARDRFLHWEQQDNLDLYKIYPLRVVNVWCPLQVGHGLTGCLVRVFTFLVEVLLLPADCEDPWQLAAL